MAIFHSYVSLLEGIRIIQYYTPVRFMEYPHLESWVTELLRRKSGKKTLWISRDAPKKELSKAKIRL
jgi:hypothetical protein